MIDFQILDQTSIPKINSTGSHLTASVLSILTQSAYYNLGQDFCFYNHGRVCTIFSILLKSMLCFDMGREEWADLIKHVSFWKEIFLGRFLIINVLKCILCQLLNLCFWEICTFYIMFTFIGMNLSAIYFYYLLSSLGYVMYPLFISTVDSTLFFHNWYW